MVLQKLYLYVNFFNINWNVLKFDKIMEEK